LHEEEEVPVHDAGRWQASGKLFYSMKLATGQSLAVLVGAYRETLVVDWG
jgi:hypothetical protein